MATLAAAVTEDGAGAVVTLAATTAGGHETACEMLLLPLRHGGEIFNRVLGSCVALVARAPMGARAVPYPGSCQPRREMSC